MHLQLDQYFKKVVLSGADGLHIHKSSIEDLKEVVEKAHKYGSVVDAYIDYPSDLHTFGVLVETLEDVVRVPKEMEAIGVDMIGLMVGLV